MNANPAAFVYIEAEGTRLSTNHLPTAMRMISGGSSCGVGTFAISASCDCKVVNGTATPTANNLAFSIKCHNLIDLDKVDYHGPPQAASVGIEISDDIMSMAKP